MSAIRIPTHADRIIYGYLSPFEKSRELSGLTDAQKNEEAPPPPLTNDERRRLLSKRDEIAQLTKAAAELYQKEMEWKETALPALIQEERELSLSEPDDLESAEKLIRVRIRLELARRWLDGVPVRESRIRLQIDGVLSDLRRFCTERFPACDKVAGDYIPPGWFQVGNGSHDRVTQALETIEELLR